MTESLDRDKNIRIREILTQNCSCYLAYFVLQFMSGVYIFIKKRGESNDRYNYNINSI